MSEEFKKLKRKTEQAFTQSEDAINSIAYGRFANRIRKLESETAEVCYTFNFSGSGNAQKSFGKDEGVVRLYCRCDNASAVSVSVGGILLDLSNGVYVATLSQLSASGSYAVDVVASGAVNVLLFLKGAGVKEVAI